MAAPSKESFNQVLGDIFDADRDELRLVSVGVSSAGDSKLSRDQVMGRAHDATTARLQQCYTE